MRITEQIVIDRPPSEVWEVVTDLSTHPRWRPAVVELRPLSDGPLAVGTRVREVLRFGGRRIELADEVTALEPERLFGMRGEWKSASFELELRLAPADDGTSVTFDWTLAPRTLLMRVAMPFLGWTMRRSTVEELAGLKEYVERGAAHASVA
jgi:uncharacterized protein YndB with AHSA1/START domain